MLMSITPVPMNPIRSIASLRVGGEIASYSPEPRNQVRSPP